MVSEKFKAWMKGASIGRKREVAANANSSLSVLYQISYSKETGGRSASSELASRLEKASDGEVTRGDISDVCRACEYWQKCQK